MSVSAIVSATTRPTSLALRLLPLWHCTLTLSALVGNTLLLHM
jgi:hypothetical protein